MFVWRDLNCQSNVYSLILHDVSYFIDPTSPTLLSLISTCLFCLYVIIKVTQLSYHSWFIYHSLPSAHDNYFFPHDALERLNTCLNIAPWLNYEACFKTQGIVEILYDSFSKESPGFWKIIRTLCFVYVRGVCVRYVL